MGEDRFHDGLRDVCACPGPVSEAGPESMWHRRYLQLSQEPGEPVVSNVLGPTLRGENSVLAGVGLFSGVGQQFLGLGGKGYSVHEVGLHMGGGDRPGGFVQVDLVPIGQPGLAAAGAGEGDKEQAEFSAHQASASRTLARALPSRG